MTIDLRIDRYTGQITTRTCPPDTQPLDAYVPPCEERSFQTSANLGLTLPKLAGNGLLLSDPSWTQGAYQTWPQVTGRDGLIVDYAAMPDLSSFEGRATFFPAAPQPRIVQIGYVRGAGNPLESVRLYLPDNPQQAVELSRTSGTDSCDLSATELWSAPVPAGFLEALRFPGSRFGSDRHSAIGYLVAKEQGSNRSAVRAFRFHFAATDPATAALAARDCPAGQPAPCIRVEAYDPHEVKVTLPSADPAGSASTGRANTGGCGDASHDCDYAELQDRANVAQAHLDPEFCLPAGATGCHAYSAAASSHQQMSRAPDVPPPGAGVSGAAGDSSTTAGWQILFDKTIPLFRWYWGVPEVFSAEVFADLRLKAEYLFNYVLRPLKPLDGYVETGGRIDVGIMIGVDVDVLFGILVDAGAAITGTLRGEVVARAEAAAPADPCVASSLRFLMDFSYWVEIGCPIDFPLDPTCWIPDIEGSHNIFNETLAADRSCVAGKQAPAPWQVLQQALAGATPAAAATTPAVAPLPPLQRRRMNRHPALSIDTAGNRLQLSVDARARLVAVDRPDGGTPVTQELSAGHGLRDVAVMHYGIDRAVAVWAESSLTGAPPAGADLASFQHLRYAVFDGDVWSAAADLTAPGYGEGGVRLARCLPRAGFYRSDCYGNKVSLVFQRNTGRTTGGESHIYLADFNGVAWSLPRRVDQSGRHNITPAIAYQDAQAVVAWVRYADDASGLSEVDKRGLALRVMDGSSAEQVDSRISRVAQPDLATTSDGRLALAFTRAASGDAFVGTRQALYLGQRLCTVDGCRISSFAVRDGDGRLLYGERPRMVANASGGVAVALRSLSYGALPGATFPESNAMPGDPIGIGGPGELLGVVSNLSAGQTQVVALSNDAGAHFQPALALDPVGQQMVAISAVVAAPALRAQALAAGDAGPRLLAKVESLDDDLQAATLADLPDLALETLASDAQRLDPGSSLAVEVGIRNGGSPWRPDAGRRATLRLFWDTPATRETLYANLEVPVLGPGERHPVQLSIPVPAQFHDDERQTLRAELLVEDPDGELDGANNSAALTIGGLPVPQGLRAQSVSGSRIVNLGWDDPADARVAGYRVWVDDAAGQPVPIGSSFNPGFADLSALYGFTRVYRVSTYSARGVESALSAPLAAAPLPAPLDGRTPRIFVDSFE